MKKLLLIIIILVGGYFIYLKFFKSNPYEIEERIIVTQASGLDINAGPSPPPKYAFIEGEMKNISDKNLSHILIIYSIGYADSLTASINFLEPGESADFKTNSSQIQTVNSKYSLVNVSYAEEN